MNGRPPGKGAGTKPSAANRKVEGIPVDLILHMLSSPSDGSTSLWVPPFCGFYLFARVPPFVERSTFFWVLADADVV
jgi:hypothetical protein